MRVHTTIFIFIAVQIRVAISHFWRGNKDINRSFSKIILCFPIRRNVWVKLAKRCYFYNPFTSVLCYRTQMIIPLSKRLDSVITKFYCRFTRFIVFIPYIYMYVHETFTVELNLWFDSLFRASILLLSI